MTTSMMRFAERFARRRQQRKIQELAQRLRDIVGSASVQAEESRVLVTGRGMVKRWLTDPNLRFLRGDLK